MSHYRHLKFSFNWNNKLDCNYYTTIRLSNSLKWVIGETYEVYLSGRHIHNATIIGKKRAKTNVLIDINSKVIHALKKELGAGAIAMNYDALTFLKTQKFNQQSFIYLDPPYPEPARRTSRPLYEYEMLGAEPHMKLLQLIKGIDANVMISTRQNSLYDRELEHWRKSEFHTTDRGGACVEIIYMNYPKPTYLHEYTYLGDDFNKRTNVKRKVSRFSNRMCELPAYERHLFIQELIANYGSEITHFQNL